MVLPGEAETWERWSAAERKRAAQIEDRDRGLRAQARAGSKLAAALLRAYQQRARRERRACRERGEDRVWFARWYARGFALGLSRVDVATNGPLDAATYPECDTIAMFAWDAGVAAGRVALPLPSVVRCTNDSTARSSTATTGRTERPTPPRDSRARDRSSAATRSNAPLSPRARAGHRRFVCRVAWAPCRFIRACASVQVRVSVERMQYAPIMRRANDSFATLAPLFDSGRVAFEVGTNGPSETLLPDTTFRRRARDAPSSG